jgi:DNA polymerase III alpha subunit
MGLDQVRDLSHRTIANILTQRPFVSLDDFLTRADPNPKEGENLALSGALRDFCSIPDALNRLKQSSWKVNQPGLFSTVTEGLPEWSLAERVAAQQNVLGASVDAHPLELFSASIATSGAVSTLEAALRIGERVTVAAVRQISRRTRTARGESMLFLVLEDREGMLDAVLFPDVYRRVRVPPGNQTPMLVTGLMEIDSKQGEPVLRVEKVEKLAVSA